MSLLRLSLMAVVVLTVLVAPAGAQDRNKLPDAAKAALDNATSLEILSLQPQAKPGEDESKLFHGYPVLAKVTVMGDDKKKVLEAIYKGIADNKGISANCFIPRHGIRASSDSRSVDLVICFECLQVEVWDGKERTRLLITASPKPVLNEFLSKPK
jgi:hypothetical protein